MASVASPPASRKTHGSKQVLAMSPLVVVILAAGQGKRMRSARPKVLHTLAGRPLLEFVVDAAGELRPSRVLVVYGHGGAAVPEALSHLDVEWVEQAERLGTGHAVQQAMAQVPDDATILVLYGDVPLVNAHTLKALLEGVDDGTIGLMTVDLQDPTGYGRVIRDVNGAVTGIVEERDADPEQRRVNEINTGILAAPAPLLRSWLGALKAENAQGEYYLTDVFAMAVGEGISISTVAPDSEHEVLGVNDRIQLARLERWYQRLQAERLMESGVTLCDPDRVDVRGQLSVGRDVLVDVNVVFEGRVDIADRVRIGPNTVIRNATIGPDTEILSHCVIEDAHTGAGCRIGPYARLRPATTLADHVHIGNFVEVKKSRVERESKINHLTYVGDSEVGQNVNIGAGTITCNYDGANKHRTIIGDRVFIGSGTQLVAPVRVGAGATVGAGSTITTDVVEDGLAVARSRQRTITGWKRPKKK